MKILIASPIDNSSIETLQERYEITCAFHASEAELQSLIRDCEVLIFRSGVNISEDVMEAAPSLKLLVRAGSGLDNLDLDYVHRRGLKLVRIPGPGAQAVAELTFGLILALARQIPEADRLLRMGHWAKHELSGYLLSGKVLGVIGAGNIGSRVGQLGAAWGLHVLGSVEHPGSERAASLLEKGIHLTDNLEVLAASDFVCIHVPLKDSTYNLIGARELELMKLGAFLINMARGGIVDERALLEVLKQNGRLHGAALDVHKSEGDGRVSALAGLPNVILTPHIGSMTIDTQRQIGEHVVEIVDAFARNGAAGAKEDTAVM